MAILWGSSFWDFYIWGTYQNRNLPICITWERYEPIWTFMSHSIWGNYSMCSNNDSKKVKGFHLFEKDFHRRNKFSLPFAINPYYKKRKYVNRNSKKYCRENYLSHKGKKKLNNIF